MAHNWAQRHARLYHAADDSPRSVPAVLEAALRANQITRTAPMGPTYICLDEELQEAKIEDDISFPDPARYAPARAAAPRPDDVRDSCPGSARAGSSPCDPSIWNSTSSRSQTSPVLSAATRSSKRDRKVWNASIARRASRRLKKNPSTHPHRPIAPRAKTYLEHRVDPQRAPARRA